MSQEYAQERSRINPFQFQALLKTRREKAQAAAQAEEHEALKARHRHEIASGVSHAVGDLTLVLEEKFLECLDGIKHDVERERELERESRDQSLEVRVFAKALPAIEELDTALSALANYIPHAKGIPDLANFFEDVFRCANAVRASQGQPPGPWKHLVKLPKVGP